MIRKSLCLLFVLALALSAYAATPITALPYTINAPGTYVLLSDLSFSVPASAAVIINSPNVVLDLQGHRIYEVVLNDPGSIGVFILGGSVTVRNGTIDRFNVSVVANATPNFKHSNITLWGLTLNILDLSDEFPLQNAAGIRFYAIQNSLIDHCAINNSDIGIIDIDGASNRYGSIAFRNVNDALRIQLDGFYTFPNGFNLNTCNWGPQAFAP